MDKLRNILILLVISRVFFRYPLTRYYPKLDAVLTIITLAICLVILFGN